MKQTRFIYTALAAMMLAAMPFTFAAAEEVADSTNKKHVVVRMKDVTVNGRPVTSTEKNVAKEMARQGAQMGGKAAQLALTSLTNPSKADSLGKELEKMGEKMERLGDSLESLSEDTTFFYEGEDSDAVVITDSDFDELKEEFEKNFGLNFNWPGGLFGGVLGVLGGIIGILIAIFVIMLLFVIFTSPLWILAFIIWLIVHISRKNTSTPKVVQTTSKGEPLKAGQTAQSEQVAQAAQTAQPQEVAPITSTPQSISDEKQEMWKSGIMYACVGVGLIALFFSIGFSDFWGIGVLVACIGVAKLIIATTTKGNS